MEVSKIPFVGGVYGAGGVGYGASGTGIIELESHRVSLKLFQALSSILPYTRRTHSSSHSYHSWIERKRHTWKSRTNVGTTKGLCLDCLAI